MLVSLNADFNTGGIVQLNRKKGILMFICLLQIGCLFIYLGVRTELSKDAQLLSKENQEQLKSVNEQINVLFP